MNKQLIEKRVDYNTLDVVEIFSTIQGEGPFTGRAAVFIRLAGCNLQCPACDTDYTSNRRTIAPSDIIQAVKLLRQSGLVVITGGEPFRQNLRALVTDLLHEGYTVQIETNGTFGPPSIGFAEMCSLDTNEPNKCFIVCSPKTGKINAEIAPLICAYKYVMDHESVSADGLPTQSLDHGATPHVARPHANFKGKIYIQPCDDKDNVINEANLKVCIHSAFSNDYILQLQLHKLIGVS